eukprot:613209-Hanusia_phi.AAC.1
MTHGAAWRTRFPARARLAQAFPLRDDGPAHDGHRVTVRGRRASSGRASSGRAMIGYDHHGPASRPGPD